MTEPSKTARAVASDTIFVPVTAAIMVPVKLSAPLTGERTATMGKGSMVDLEALPGDVQAAVLEEVTAALHDSTMHTDALTWLLSAVQRFKSDYPTAEGWITPYLGVTEEISI